MIKKDFWKMAGDRRKAYLDVLMGAGIALTPEDIFRETVIAVLDTTLDIYDLYPMSKINAEFEDFLHDRRSECLDSPYLRTGRVERNG